MPSPSSSSSMTANVEEARAMLAEERSSITLGHQPVRTVALFCTAAARWVRAETAAVARRPAVRQVVVPLTLVALFISRFVVADDGIWRECEYILADGLFWLVLGILSSIGLGTGMHSGVLFLFPHIYLTCAAATTCGNTDFWTYPSNPFYGPRDRRFVCLSRATASGGNVAFWQCLLKVMPACVLWGSGTAIGEVPPYALSYAAASQGKRQLDLEPTEESSPFNVMQSMKQWTLNKIERYGFWAILLLAAWPNMAFDLCGMACGQFMMPFWTFFGATFIGKALIKVNLQAVFFVVLFSGDNVERVVRHVSLAVASHLPSRLDAESGVQKAVAAIGSARNSIRARATGSSAGSASSANESDSVLMTLMQWIVTLAVLWFAKSIVDTFAQSEQEKRDEGVVEALAAVLAEEGDGRTQLGRGELSQLIRRVRLDDSGATHSVSRRIGRLSTCGGRRASAGLSRRLRQRAEVGVLLGLVAVGLATRRTWLVVLAANLLFHHFLFHHMSSNLSMPTWQRGTVRVLMAVAVVYTLCSNL